MSKVMGIFVKFWHFYDASPPNMAMSGDPRSKFRKKFIFLVLHLILGKFTKFIVEKLSTSEVTSQKPHGGRGWKHSAFRVRSQKFFFVCQISLNI